MNSKQKIAHVLYRLDTGGMERILVSIIQGTHERFAHTVITLAGFGEIRREVEALGVACVSLNKKAGKDWSWYLRLRRLLRTLRPDLVQTYNLGTLDAAPVAKLAGVQRVLHAEHGRDSRDPAGQSRKYRILRRLMAPFIDRYVVVSHDLERWLTSTIGIDATKVIYLPNGVDIGRFALSSRRSGPRPLLGDFALPGTFVIGTVGRLDPVKDQTALIVAFHQLCKCLPATSHLLRLIIVGEGPQREVLEKLVGELGISKQVRLLGNRKDVAELLREFDLFALSSQAEGMPVTALEAMAAGLPVVATAVGGVSEVVVNGVTGTLVPAGDCQALTAALVSYTEDTGRCADQGRAGAARATASFSLPVMLSAYSALYDSLLTPTAGAIGPTLPERMHNCRKEP